MTRITKSKSNAKLASQSLKKHANPKSAAVLSRFFKTAKGEYGEGDIFLGIKVPQTRTVAQQFHDLPPKECLSLLKSKIHEERLLALLILCEQFKKGSDAEKKKIHNFYLKNIQYVNNWDLVDTSAALLVGSYLVHSNKDILYKLARSKNLWEKRVAIIATFHFIRNKDFKDTVAISEILLSDKHDLIHKAVGWMIREVGKRDFKTCEKFLIKHYKKMPRTMLRYAIEKFPEQKRKKYLKGEI